MTNKWDILYWATYVTSYSPDLKESKQCFGFTIRNEFDDEEEFQKEPYLTMAKEKIIGRLKKRGYTDITITSIKAVHIREKKRRGNTINRLLKTLLRF